MNAFKSLRKLQKDKVVRSGAIKRVADRTGKDKSTVSRTFSGYIKVPDPQVVAGLREEVRAVLGSAVAGWL